jgi:hypothetical protein
MYMYIIPLRNKWEGTEAKFVAYLVVTLEIKGDDILAHQYIYRKLYSRALFWGAPRYLVPGSSC